MIGLWPIGSQTCWRWGDTRHYFGRVVAVQIAVLDYVRIPWGWSKYCDASHGLYGVDWSSCYFHKPFTRGRNWRWTHLLCPLSRQALSHLQSLRIFFANTGVDCLAGMAYLGHSTWMHGPSSPIAAPRLDSLGPTALASWISCYSGLFNDFYAYTIKKGNRKAKLLPQKEVIAHSLNKRDELFLYSVNPDPEKPLLSWSWHWARQAGQYDPASQSQLFLIFLPGRGRANLFTTGCWMN